MGDRAETRDGLGMPYSVLHTLADKNETVRNSKREQKAVGV